ncbi:MAG: hypothetical protein LBM92_04585 [Opitutaceae bacterium]|jgi:hypothetical protein|nr:hypothetical protein [Opitutaceae bacterium]
MNPSRFFYPSPLPAIVLLLAAAFGFVEPPLRAAGQLYTCGMHPQIIKTEPGDCPICGMKLTPVRANTTGEKTAAAPSENTIQIDAATTQRMNLKTALVARGPVRRELRATGAVAYNEEGFRDITTKYEGWIEKLFAMTGFVGAALLVTGGLIYTASRLVGKGAKTERTLKLKDAFLIGLAQAAALLPGVSRSGATIATGLARGADGDFAVRFSILLSVPAVIGSLLLTLFSALRTGIEWSYMPAYLIGALVAAITGYFSIQILRRVLAKGKFKRFAYYCWFVGALSIILSFFL